LGKEKGFLIGQAAILEKEKKRKGGFTGKKK